MAQKYNLLPDTIFLCAGDTASIEIRQDLGGSKSIKWFTPGGQFNNTNKISASKAGKYLIELSQAEKTPLRDSSYLKIFNKPRKLLLDTLLCRGKTVTLDARNPGMRYIWSNGQTTQKINVNTAGRYWVKIMNGKCSVIDTVQVKTQAGATVSVQHDYTFCLNDENKVITIKTGPDVSVLWHNGASTPTMPVTREGLYWVQTESSACGKQTDTIKVKLKACECEMLIPNSFSPNEDGKNDYFYPVTQCDYTYYLMTISDRWGNTVFTSNMLSGKWDGRFKGNLCTEDIYIYRIESTEKSADKKQVRTGHVSLFR